MVVDGFLPDYTIYDLVLRTCLVSGKIVYVNELVNLLCKKTNVCYYRNEKMFSMECQYDSFSATIFAGKESGNDIVGKGFD
eukprot:Pgem_evm1s14147